MAVVPSPVRRVLRDRMRLVAVALLALVSVAAAGINATAAERLQALLDENWRGAYDILVTAEGSELAGLLPPNSLAAGAQGMTFDDLSAIRAVDGIEVAAPIGEVIVPALAARQVQIALPKGAAGADDVPQAFRVTLTQGTYDGLADRLISKEVFEIVVDETERPAPERPAIVSCNYDGFDVDPEEYPLLIAHCGGVSELPIVSHTTNSGWGSSSDVQGDSVLFTLGSAVLPSTRITLVDPVAERALLGDAGSFLAPLEALAVDGGTPGPRITEWADTAGDEFSQKFLDQQIALAGLPTPFTPELLDELSRLHEANGQTFEWGPSAVNYVPLVVREKGPAPFTVTMEVESFGPAPPLDPEQSAFPYLLPEALTAGAAGTRLGFSGVDASSMLNPFSEGHALLPWPGTTADGVEGMPWFGSLSISGSGTAPAPDFEVVADDADGVEVRVRSSGYVYPLFSNNVNPDPYISIESSGTKLGMESVFGAGVKTRSVMPEHGLNAVAVGGFSLDGIAALQSELSHVPLGAYGSVGSTLIPGSSEEFNGAFELTPSVSGLGLVSAETVAIASVSSAAAWGEEAPINAVRVRVAGVDSFSSAGIATIASVAQQLEEIGFTATIVAGSSPTDVTVHVEDYAFGVSDADVEQRIGHLGAVTQRWSELGAASRVDLAVSASSFGVLAVALGASALLLAAVQLASVPGRRAQASVLRTIGWRRRRIVRWMAAEEAISIVVVAAAGAIALALASSRSTVGIIVAASLAAIVVTSAVAVGLGARPIATGIRPLRRGRRRHRSAEVRAWVTSQLRFATRQLAVHRLNAIVQVLATIVVAVAAAAVTVTVIEGRAAAGSSALGGFAVDQALVAQLGLGLIALIAGVVLAVIARRIDLGRRREQWATMRSMGWSAGQVRVVQLIEGAIIGLPAVAIAGGLALLYLSQIAPAIVEIALPIAIAASGILTVILVLTSWREKR